MPRDGSGNYTLPSGNPVSTGTTIQSTWANPTMSDIAVQLNNVLTRDGVLGPTNPVKFPDGTVAAPAITFNSESTLGWFRPGAQQINVAVLNAVVDALNAGTAASVNRSIYPRAAGESSISLNTDPAGTANTTSLRIRQDATSGYIESIAQGSGTVKNITYTANTHIFNGSTNLAPVGDIHVFYRKSVPAGWIEGKGGTISSAAGGGTTRANDDTLNLFTLWWTDFNDSELPIQTSAGGASTRGASAAADWAANKRMTVPDLRNRFARAADGTNTVVGVMYADTFASHNHGVNESAHSHTAGDFGHGHGAGTDVQGNHQHTYTVTAAAGFVAAPGGIGINYVSALNAAATSADGNHAHNVSINTGYGNIYTNGAVTGITTQAAGSTETRPKSYGALVCIKL